MSQDQSQSSIKRKPRLRGHFHQAGFFLALGAGLMLIAEFHERDFGFILTYVISLCLLYGVSALYHRPNWDPVPRLWFRKMDHAAIYLLIAGSATPIGARTLSHESLKTFLILIWCMAGAGCVQSFLWTRAPKLLRVGFYLIMGYLAMPYLSEIDHSLKGAGLELLLGGGLAYTVGAVIYAFKKPNFFDGELGYHELFHLLVILGSACHFVLIRSLFL